MSDIDYHQVIKWVIIVIVAGFLGQFGRSFAKYLIEKARRKKAAALSDKPESSLKPEVQPPTVPESPGATDTDDKAAKKALKAAVKLKKKGG